MSEASNSNIRFICINCYSTIDAEEDLTKTKQICPHCGNPVRVPKASLKYGEMINQYKVEKFIGVGGMGEVYQATDSEDGRSVALKIIRPEVINEEEIESFKKEIRMNLRVSHNNFVKAYEAGTDEKGRNFLALEYVKGRSLEDHIIKRGRFEEDHALSIILTVAKALCSAWKNWKIIHRDIKPSNILITQSNVVKIMDLGISTPEAENAEETYIIGTPYYMSPEQIRTPSKIDQRSDIYSLGATLYELLTGMEPFQGADSDNIYNSVLNDKPKDPKILRPKLSPETCALIEKFMQKDMNRRPSDWDEAIKDIEMVMNRHEHTDLSNPGKLDPSMIYCMNNDMKSYSKFIILGVIGAAAFLGFAFWIVKTAVP